MDVPRWRKARVTYFPFAYLPVGEWYVVIMSCNVIDNRRMDFMTIVVRAVAMITSAWFYEASLSDKNGLGLG